jgi:MraZ protein
MFSGSFVHSVDDKNRLAIPAKFRKALGSTFMLTKGPDGCLWALPMERWNLLLSKAGQSVTIQRFFHSFSVSVYTRCKRALPATGRAQKTR